MKRGTALWTKILKRSIFEWTFVQKVFLLAEETGFESVSEELRACLLNVFCNIGQTKIIEDGFRLLRAEEIKAQWKKLMAQARGWLHLIRSDLLTAVHRFQEIDYRDQTAPTGSERKQMTMNGLYHPRQAACKLPLGLVATPQQTPCWPSFSPVSVLALLGDLALMLHCSDVGDWLSAKFTWLSALCWDGVLVKHDSWDHWCLCIGSVGHATLGWPMELVVEGGVRFFKSVADVRPTDIVWLILTCLDGWQEQPVQWLSPWCQSLVKGKKSKVASDIRAQAAGAPPVSSQLCSLQRVLEFANVILGQTVGLSEPVFC